MNRQGAKSAKIREFAGFLGALGVLAVHSVPRSRHSARSEYPLIRIDHCSGTRDFGRTVRHLDAPRRVADPHVELQDGTEKKDMVAREVTGEERAEWWERAVAAYPDYADYQRRTARTIPVFVLEPAAG